MSNTRETFADRLAWAIEETDATNSELARRVGLHRSTVGDYVKNGVMPSIDTARRIAECLGVSLEWLVTGEGPVRAGSWIVRDRHIAEVDGLIRDWNKPVKPEAERMRQAFQKGFRRAAYPTLAPVVQMAFQNLLARVMHSLRRAGHRDVVADAERRGAIAALVLEGRVRPRTGRTGSEAGYDRKPASTRRWLAAIADEMGDWENGSMPRSFELPEAHVE